MTNTGTIQASNGGNLQLTAGFLSVPFNNTGGTIQALSGSTDGIVGWNDLEIPRSTGREYSAGVGVSGKSYRLPGDKRSDNSDRRGDRSNEWQ